MSFVIENSNFYKIPKIVSVKTYIKRLGEHEVINNVLKGRIHVDIYYLDNNEEENFTTFSFDYFVSIPQDVFVNDIVLKDLKLEVVEIQGVNANYILEIMSEEDEQNNTKDLFEETDYKEYIEQSTVNVTPTASEEETKEEDDKSLVLEIKKSEIENEEIKQNLIVEYDKLLEKTLNEERNEELRTEENKPQDLTNQMDVKVTEDRNYNEEIKKDECSKDGKEILRTTTSSTPLDFINYFNKLETKYYKVKSIKVEDENQLVEISQKYNVTLDLLYKSYDKDNKVVIVKCN